MIKIRIILENDLGESIDLKSYELGSNFNKMSKLGASISAVSDAMLSNITAGVLSLEEQSFKKSDYKANGSYEIMVSTLNGYFP